MAGSELSLVVDVVRVAEVDGRVVPGETVMLPVLLSGLEVAFRVVAPLLVDFGMEGNLLHEEGDQEAETGDGDADPPCKCARKEEV